MGDRFPTTTIRIQLPKDSEGLGAAVTPQTMPAAKLLEDPAFRNLVNSIYDGVLITSCKGMIKSSNVRLGELAGGSASRLLGTPVSSFIGGIDDDLVATLDHNAGKKLMTLIEADCIRLDSSTFPAEISVSRLMVDQEPHLIFCVRNIARRKEAEAALHEAYRSLDAKNSELELSRRRLEEAYAELQRRGRRLTEERDLLDQLVYFLPEAVSVKDASGRLVRVNAAMCELYKKRPDDLIGCRTQDLLPPDVAIRLQELDDIAMSGHPVIDRECALVMMDGSDLGTYLISKIPLRNAEGKTTGVITVLRNISHAKRTLELLKQAKVKAEEASKLKSDFLANISHELRTPLSPIIGFTTLIRQMAESGELENASTQEFTNYVLEAATHLQNIIEDLLIMARSDRQMDEDIATFPVKDLFSELSHLHGYPARKKKQNLVVRCPEEPELMLNSRRKPIFHIVSNFIGNAVKFTPDQGEITITAELKPDGRLRLSVQDTGIGIKTEDINRIFDRFVQADEVLTKSYGGTGLGLAIAKEMAETLGAELEVSSIPGQGSSFALILPSSTVVS